MNRFIILFLHQIIVGQNLIQWHLSLLCVACRICTHKHLKTSIIFLKPSISIRRHVGIHAYIHHLKPSYFKKIISPHVLVAPNYVVLNYKVLNFMHNLDLNLNLCISLQWELAWIIWIHPYASSTHSKELKIAPKSSIQSTKPSIMGSANYIMWFY